MKRLALASALSDRAADNKIRVLESFGIDTPKTKDAIALLSKLDVYGRILVVIGSEDHNAAKSFSNLVGVDTITQDQLNTYDILVNDFIIFTKESFEAACAFRPAPEARRAARVEAALAASGHSTGATDATDDSAEQRSDAASANDEEEE
jgi:large subunit ribosomal protein L4